ncbi:MAG: hypothetical protein EOO90_02580 [Pedobacter sp.]|nr:MAG: hypothetical protein EOO90_02580 [Pedobacter sp.]
MSSDQQAIKSDALKYLPVKVLPAISGLLTIYFLTRSLNTATYAVYSFLFAAVLLSIQLSAGWLNSAVIYFYPEAVQSNETDKLRSNVSLLQFYLFLVVAVVLGLVCYLGGIAFSLTIAGITVMFGQIFINLMYSFLQAERKVYYQLISTTIQSLFQIVFVFICYKFFPQNLLMIVSGIALSYVIALVYLRVFAMSLKMNRLKIDMEIAKKVLHYGLPICVWFFASQFYTIGDRILLKYFKIVEGVGNYTSFRDLAVGLSGFLTMPLLLAAHPVIMNMWKEGNQVRQIEQLMAQNIRILLLFLVTSCSFMFVAGEWLMVKLVSAEYLLEAPYMCIILMSIFIGAIGMYIHKALEVTHRTLLMGKIAVCIAISSFIINLWVLPRFGVNGAIIVNLACHICYLVVVYNFSYRILKPKVSFSFVLRIFAYALLVILLDQALLFGLKPYYTETFRFLYVILSCMLILYKSEDIRSLLAPIINRLAK